MANRYSLIIFYERTRLKSFLIERRLISWRIKPICIIYGVWQNVEHLDRKHLFRRYRLERTTTMTPVARVSRRIRNVASRTLPVITKHRVNQYTRRLRDFVSTHLYGYAVYKLYSCTAVRNNYSTYELIFDQLRKVNVSITILIRMCLSVNISFLPRVRDN